MPRIKVIAPFQIDGSAPYLAGEHTIAHHEYLTALETEGRIKILSVETELEPEVPVKATRKPRAPKE